MSAGAASLEIDAQALALLDELLDVPASERDARVESLGASHPALQERVRRLLRAVVDTDGSRAVAAPALAGLRWAAGPLRQPGQTLAGWRLLRELGRGGMAEVWLAERAEGGLKREAAIKLPLAAQPSAVLAERFARERDVLAALDHPHIARLFDAGVAEDGQPYIVLEHVRGLTLTEYARARALTNRQRLALFRQVLAAVDHAHRHLVVHRDLKPGNVLVTEEGQVKLLDFGIAKLLAPPADSAALTQDAAVLTPRYAAPEQVRGEVVSTATDVYAAGVLLYELLTGALPYGAAEDGVAQLVQAVVQAEPRPPGLGRDLDTVLLKALRKAPGERYATAERFDEDLRRLLADEPILARRVPPWRRAQLLWRRHRLLGSAGGLAALALAGMAAVAWKERLASQAQEARAVAVRGFLFEMVSDVEPVDGAAAGDVSGRQIVAAAVARAREQFAGEPVVRGEILGELGRIHQRLGEDETATALLREAIALLQPRVAPDHGGLNYARAWLAQNLAGSDRAGAVALAEQALAACTSERLECLKTRLYAHGTLRNIHSNTGRTEAALAHARAAVQASTAAFGERQANTAAAWQFLALVARNAARYDEAAQAIGRAVALSAGTPIRAAERITLERTRAYIAFDLGDYDAARRQLADLVGRTTDPVERANQLRALSAAHYALGDGAAALAAAEQALAGARKAGARRSEALALLAQARPLAWAGRHAEALAALDAAVAGMNAIGFAPDAADPLRALRQRAETQLRMGDPAAAEPTLAALLAGHERAAGQHPVDRAQALDLAGCAALAAGRPAQALALHLSAAATLAPLLPAGHPLRLRNGLLAALARTRAEPSAANRQALDAAAGALRAVLPASSSWRAATQPDRLSLAGGAQPPLLIF